MHSLVFLTAKLKLFSDGSLVSSHFIHVTPTSHSATRSSENGPHQLVAVYSLRLRRLRLIQLSSLLIGYPYKRSRISPHQMPFLFQA